MTKLTKDWRGKVGSWARAAQARGVRTFLEGWL